MTNSIREQVEENLPAYKTMSDEQLAALIGRIVVADPEERGLPKLAELGRMFVQTNNRVRHIICDAANKELIGNEITADNVATIVNLVITAFGFVPGAAVPAWTIALAVFVLKLGLNAYCKG